MVKSMRTSLTIPHFGYSDEVVLDQCTHLRSSLNKILKSKAGPSKTAEEGLTKISYMPIFMKSFSIALQQFPVLNAQLIHADSPTPQLVYKAHHNIGIAMDTPAGLVVPNIKHVESKSIFELGLELLRLQDLASRGAIPPEDFRGATITVSNIGNIGGRVLSPVIPPDTLCIVALGKAQKLPRFVPIKRNDEGDYHVTSVTGEQHTLAAQQIMTVSFSADHRVVDGATVARFSTVWKRLLENPEAMLGGLK
jgi:2-oxoisovalerate dehydrogenase E2 component (dihydrolipoyl transacylase)